MSQQLNNGGIQEQRQGRAVVGVDLFVATTTRILVGFNKYKHGQGALYAGLPQQQLIISTMG